MNHTYADKIQITEKDLASYNEQGFLKIRHPVILKLNTEIQQILQRYSLVLLERFDEASDHLSRFSKASFPEIINWCVSNEKEGRISRSFYEVLPALAEIIELVNHPLYLSIARQVGLSLPIPGTLPLLRIDRPRESVHNTPAHQDYWFSMLSHNSIVIWFPPVAIEEEMGLLQVIPKSHKHGLVPFKRGDNDNPFKVAEVIPDSDYIKVPIRMDELLVFSQFLIHRSGINISQNTRVAMQQRYNDIKTLDEITSSFTPAHSNYVLSRQKQVILTEESEKVSLL